MVKPAGNHLAFPFRVSSNGSIEHVSNLEEHVRQELIQLVLTDIGERLFLPDFGGGARSLVFKNMDDEISSITKSTLAHALTLWLGHRIVIEDLTISVQESVRIDIKYRLAGTDDSRDIMFQQMDKR
jgi:phage baseplate assembly protein W